MPNASRPPRACLGCGRVFAPRDARNVNCSAACNRVARLCKARYVGKRFLGATDPLPTRRTGAQPILLAPAVLAEARAELAAWEARTAATSWVKVKPDGTPRKHTKGGKRRAAA